MTMGLVGKARRLGEGQGRVERGWVRWSLAGRVWRERMGWGRGEEVPWSRPSVREV